MYTICQSETVTFGPSTPSVWFSQTFTVNTFDSQQNSARLSKPKIKLFGFVQSPQDHF